MDTPCDYCSENFKHGDEILEEVSTWKAMVAAGVRAMEMVIPTGKWMHRTCALMKKQDADQKPGQTSLI